jgi:hypothetical protein
MHMQIPKAQKDTDDLTVFFALLESSSVKAVRKCHRDLRKSDISGNAKAVAVTRPNLNASYTWSYFFTCPILASN